ncbi:hypothetical protein BDN72DRAFT_849488 [Pluteus cervinus]|uniref:Uncharacterized protein n=1 Tax=Pluteus cervinus TaxID=181527 RepID=A0ACD3A8L9_9AGAR|nr:hypothetical protein BDN72DRAFT_849488 [Pluteus cervinus]
MTTATDLPFELVQEILIASAWSSLNQAATLARISHHIYDLVKPILFRTLVYWDEDTYWPCRVDSGWLKLNGRQARNILFGDNATTSEDVVMVLESCPNLIHIAIWLDTEEHDITSLLEPLSKLHPYRLSMDLNTLFGGVSFQEEHAQPPMFINLTHLEMANSCEDWECMEGIQHLPKLTHLSLPRNRDSEQATVSIIQNAFAHCPHLFLVVLFSSLSTRDITKPGEVVIEGYLPPQIRAIGDPRVVSLACAYFKEWLVGSQGGRDMWVVAEEIVERQRSTGNL